MAIYVLLSLDQFRQVVPAYVSRGTLIMYETVEMAVHEILGLCQKPLSLLKWDPSTSVLSQVCEQVSLLSVEGGLIQMISHRSTYHTYKYIP